MVDLPKEYSALVTFLLTWEQGGGQGLVGRVDKADRDLICPISPLEGVPFVPRK